MKLALAALLSLSAAPAFAGPTVYTCQEQKPKFGPATKAFTFSRTSPGRFLDGIPQGYLLQVTERGQPLLSAFAAGRKDGERLVFRVPREPISGHLQLTEPLRAELKLSGRLHRFLCSQK